MKTGFGKVPGAGLEPARPQWPLDFKSNVSTNSTTRAYLKILNNKKNLPLKEKSRLPLRVNIGILLLSERRDSNSRP